VEIGADKEAKDKKKGQRHEEEGKGEAEEIDDDEIVAAIETKQLKGQKLTKDQRREIKWAAKRGEKIEVRNGELIMSKKPAKNILGI